jgi:hypothetical protein
MTDEMLRFMCVERVLAVYRVEHVTVRDFSAVLAEAKELYVWITGNKQGEVTIGGLDETLRQIKGGSLGGYRDAAE